MLYVEHKKEPRGSFLLLLSVQPLGLLFFSFLILSLSIIQLSFLSSTPSLLHPFFFLSTPSFLFSLFLWVLLLSAVVRCLFTALIFLSFLIPFFVFCCSCSPPLPVLTPLFLAFTFHSLPSKFTPLHSPSSFFSHFWSVCVCAQQSVNFLPFFHSLLLSHPHPHPHPHPHSHPHSHSLPSFFNPSLPTPIPD